jgi:hypothetical protein
MPRGGGKYVGRQGDSRQTGIGGKIGKCFDKYGKDRYAILDFPILEIGMATLEETPSRIEPCLLDETSPAIIALVASLSGETHALGARLQPKSAAGLAELVRVMNCYYSNLIEGHNTTPRELERALQDRLDAAEDRRNLQLEARAHIRVQREVDRLHTVGELPEPASVEFIRWLHRAFYEDAPVSMLRIEGAGRVLRIHPLVVAAAGEAARKPARYRPQPVRADAGGKRHRMAHQAADTPVAVEKRVNVVEPVVRGGHCRDPRPHAQIREAVAPLEMRHEGLDPAARWRQVAADIDILLRL